MRVKLVVFTVGYEDNLTLGKIYDVVDGTPVTDSVVILDDAGMLSALWDSEYEVVDE